MSTSSLPIRSITWRAGTKARSRNCSFNSIGVRAGLRPALFFVLVVEKASVSCRRSGSRGVRFTFETGLQTTDEHVKNGDKDQIQKGGRDHAAENGGAHGAAADAAGAFGDHQGQDAKDKSERSHHNRAQADAGGLR